MKLSVSLKQISEISEKNNLILYSDETAKFGKSFEVFTVTDENKTNYLLVLREMYSKRADSVLDTFKEVLKDINETCCDITDSDIYYHQKNMTDFLENTHGCTNRLLSNIKVLCYVAGCRAPGLVSKLITAPFWRDI
ncbi:hypothetical protein KUTeg_020906 [Tegillarca granosa]|uniref:Uncharacterized protein n=1 Tax=Tegillarca granosa TaxID=220873 RepID=A0ABQ9EBP5_TEGGR|nr:hypothetical protein KUTeg_020906 [Tegillarca granosa]